MPEANHPPIKRHCMVVHAYYSLLDVRVQKETKALVDGGFEVDVICLRNPGERPRASECNVQIYRLPVKRHKQHSALIQLLEYLAFFLLATWQLLKLHLKKRYATIQVHNLPDFLVFSALVPKILGARVILDLHDLMPEFYAARFGSNLNTFPVKLVKFQEKISCWLADHVITVTEAWHQTLIERGVPADECSVVMNLPDTGIFQTEEEGSSQASHSDGLTRLFYHGNVTYRYGLDILVRAFEQVHKQLPHTRLTIHGRGDYQLELENLIDDLGLGHVVTLSTELIPLEEVVSLIKSADLAVVPYRRDVFTDGILPTKLMEYAALGIPAIVARTPGISAYFDETMVEFFTAESVDELARCIQTLYHNRARLDELARNIQKFNQRYNWASHKVEYVNLVNGLAKH